MASPHSATLGEGRPSFVGASTAIVLWFAIASWSLAAPTRALALDERCSFRLSENAASQPASWEIHGTGQIGVNVGSTGWTCMLLSTSAVSRMLRGQNPALVSCTASCGRGGISTIITTFESPHRTLFLRGPEGTAHWWSLDIVKTRSKSRYTWAERMASRAHDAPVCARPDSCTASATVVSIVTAPSDGSLVDVDSLPSLRSEVPGVCHGWSFAISPAVDFGRRPARARELALALTADGRALLAFAVPARGDPTYLLFQDGSAERKACVQNVRLVPSAKRP